MPRLFGTHSSTRGRPLGQSCLPHRGKLSHIRGRDETENDCHSPACSLSRPSLQHSKTTWAGQWACGTRLDREGTWAAGIELGRRDGEN